MIFDEGYQFGLGAFETIAIYKGKAVFLEEHLQRLRDALTFLEIVQEITTNDVYDFIIKNNIVNGAIKIILSNKNIFIFSRDNPYDFKFYSEGFKLNFSDIRRNETSPFTYHKTLNYGECIITKRMAKKLNVDDMIFLNTKEQICECSTCNIFFVKNGIVYTPPVESGILRGIVRNYICDEYPVKEKAIYVKEIVDYDECFVTNSLMGIVPVKKIGEHYFKKCEFTESVYNRYFQHCLSKGFYCKNLKKCK